MCPHDHIIAVGKRRTIAHCCTYTEDRGGRGTKSSLLLPYSSFLGFSSPASSVSEHRSRLTDLSGLLRKTAAALLTQPHFSHLLSPVHFFICSIVPTASFATLSTLLRPGSNSNNNSTGTAVTKFAGLCTDLAQVEVTLLIIS